MVMVESCISGSAFALGCRTGGTSTSFATKPTVSLIWVKRRESRRMCRPYWFTQGFLSLLLLKPVKLTIREIKYPFESCLMKPSWPSADWRLNRTTSFSAPVFSEATADCEVLCFGWIIFTLANSQGQDQTENLHARFTSKNLVNDFRRTKNHWKTEIREFRFLS